MKANLIVSLTIGALVVANPAAAQTFVNSLDARIQGASLANTANLAATGTTPGYLEIKSGSSLSSSSRKSYFHFDLGANPNTNANAVFTLVFPFATPASQPQRVQLYALNQAYAGGFDPTTITWNNAQANSTNDASALLTDGSTSPYTATPLVSVVTPQADSAHTAYSFTLQAGTNSTSWGNFVKNGTVTLALTGIPDTAYNGNGPVRSPTNASTLAFYAQIGAGPMPSITVCTNVTTYPTIPSATNYFTVSPSGLAPTATSDNQAIVADSDIHVEGSGANWKVYAIGGTTPGTANVILTVTDGLGNPANANFKVTVNPVVPIVSNPPDTNTLTGIAVTVPFTVWEPLSNANNISIWATSLNTNLVPDTNLQVTKDAGGTNRTVKVTPLPGTNGIAPIALWASDGFNSNRTAFVVQVRPSANVAFFDAFAYTTNLTSFGNATMTNDIGRLDLASGSFWKVRAGTSPAIFILNGQAQLTYPSGSTTPQSLIAALVGGPYVPGKDAIIYTSFKATWTALPVDSGTMVSLYDPNASGTVGLLARVATVLTNASTAPAPGMFRVGVANGEGTAGTTNYIDYPLDLAVGSTYTIATRYVVDAAKTTLWVTNFGSIISEANPGTVAQDSHTARPVSSVSLRQGTDTGPVLIDDLKVTVVTRPSFVSVTPSGSTVTIVFAAGANDSASDFGLNATYSLPIPLAPVSATITSLGGGLFQATLPAVGSQGYYQLKRQLMVFP